MALTEDESIRVRMGMGGNIAAEKIAEAKQSDNSDQKIALLIAAVEALIEERNYRDSEARMAEMNIQLGNV